MTADDRTHDPVADASRAGDGDPTLAEPQTAGTLTPGTATEEGLSTVPLSAEDLDPDEELLAGAPLDDDPGADSSVD
jgi:hypothetical protein